MVRFVRNTVGCLLIAPAIAAVAPASAQENGTPVGDIARQAEIIAVGKVTATKAEWDRTNDRIITNVTVNVGEYLKGNAGNVVVITAPGGEVNGIGEWYSHTARFGTDEEVVVFAKRDKGGKFRVTGGEGGKVRIERDTKTGSAIVHGNRPLADFKKEIAAAIQSREAK